MTKFYTNVEVRGNHILYRGYDNGLPVQQKIQYRPHLFTPTKDETKYHVFKSNKPVQKKEFDSISDMKEFVEQYKDVPNFEFYGCSNIVRQFVGNYFREEIKWDASQAQIWFFDIETEVEGSKFPEPDLAEERIQLVSMMNSTTKAIHVWSLHAVEANTLNEFSDIKFRNFENDEKALLKDLILFFADSRIDVLSGWNSDPFDVPYLVNRIKKVLGDTAANYLSPWRIVKPRNYMNANGESTNTYDIVGITHLDYLELYKKFNPGSKESFKLDYIAEIELGKNKVELPGESFRDSYKNFYSEFCRYNIIDTHLLNDLEEKLQQVRLAMQLAFFAKCQFGDVVSAMRLWESIIYNYFLELDIVEEYTKTNKEKKSIVGAYVHEPIPGKYGWTVSLDFASLYPSIIMQNNISPETVVSYDETGSADFVLSYKHIGNVKDNTIFSANGLSTSKQFEGFVPILVRRMIDLRKIAKGKMLEKKKEEQTMLQNNSSSDAIEAIRSEIQALNISQSAFKVASNSFFGCLALSHFKYYDYRLAEAITMSGQAFILKSREILNNIFTKITGVEYNYCSYSDTDSVVGESVVYVNGKEITIADLYDSISEYNQCNDFNKSYVKPAVNMTTLSFNTETETINVKPIKYVMKHRVNKRMFRISIGDKSVTVTEDHSIIVQRNDIYMSVKPTEITESDVLISVINLNVEKTSNFLIEDLGIQEIDVYDIEVEGNHNFFANDILVHNSSYIDVQKIVDAKLQNKTDQEIVDYLEKLIQKVVQPALNAQLYEFAKTIGCDKSYLDKKLECIGPSIVYLHKKKYAFDILYSEGVRYSKPKMKVMGIEIVRSSTPNVVKDYLKDCLALCLRSTQPELQSKIKEVKKTFMQQNYVDISFPRGVNGMDVYSDASSIYKKGCPIHVRGALLYNHTLDRLGLGAKYPKIADGNKVKFVALKMPNPLHENVIAFPSKLPDEFGLHKYVDYKVQFEKAFLAPLENILDAIGWEAEEKVKLDFD